MIEVATGAWKRPLAHHKEDRIMIDEKVLDEVLEEAICFGRYCYRDFEKKKAELKTKLAKRLQEHTYLPQSISEALNSGDGVYRP